MTARLPVQASVWLMSALRPAQVQAGAARYPLALLAARHLCLDGQGQL
jgi:hypothetical protein